MAVIEACCNGTFVLIISRSEDQAFEFFRRVIGCYNRLKRLGYLMPEPVRKPTMSEIEMVNGGRILALPHSEDTIVGYSSVSLLIMDEAARIKDEVFLAVSPMLAVARGRMMALSTPKGQRGWFWKEWQRCDAAVKGGLMLPYRRMRKTYADCPRFTPGFIAQEKAKGDLYFRQEFGTEFLPQVTGSPFDMERMQSLLEDMSGEW